MRIKPCDSTSQSHISSQPKPVLVAETPRCSQPASLLCSTPLPKPTSPDNLLVSEEIKYSQRFTKYFKSNEPLEKGLAGISQPTQTFLLQDRSQTLISPSCLWLVWSHCCCHSRCSHPVVAVYRVHGIVSKGFPQADLCKGSRGGVHPQAAMDSMEQGQALSCPQGL